MKTQINPNESLLFNTTIFKQLTNILDANKSWRILAENSKQFEYVRIKFGYKKMTVVNYWNV